MTNNIHVAVIGCGGIANGKHFPALSKLKHVDIIAFYDVERERAARAAEQYGAPGAKVYDNYEDLLADQSIDVVHVCTPNATHATITISALEAGKHVLCEKPMAHTAADARKMVEAANRTGKKLSISYNNRFRPDSQLLKQMCEAGELGDIYFAKAHAIRRRGVPTWGVFMDKELQGGGPLIDIGSHALDLTLWLMDNYEPKAVLGTAFNKLSQRRNAANSWGPWNPDTFKVEDSAFAMIVMKNGATIMLESSWALNTMDAKEAVYTLCGTEGGADVKDYSLRINGEQYGRLYTKQYPFEPKHASNAEKPSDKEIRLWIEAVMNDTQPIVTPEQACVVSEIIEAVYTSNQTGQAVYFD